MMLSMGNSMFGINTINREAAKKIILKIFYSKNSHFKEEKEVFRNLYPGVESLIGIIKCSDHRVLSILLMRMEAYLILDVVCEKLCELHPDLPIFTIHDSLLTTEGNEKLVEPIIIEELYMFIGITPTLELMSLI